MIFDFHRERFSSGIQAGTFGNRPAHQNAVHFKAEIIVETSGIVPLHAEEASAIRAVRSGLLRCWLRRFVEVPFARVLFETHYLRPLCQGRDFTEDRVSCRDDDPCYSENTSSSLAVWQ